MTLTTIEGQEETSLTLRLLDQISTVYKSAQKVPSMISTTITSPSLILTDLITTSSWSTMAPKPRRSARVKARINYGTDTDASDYENDLPANKTNAAKPVPNKRIRKVAIKAEDEPAAKRARKDPEQLAIKQAEKAEQQSTLR